MYYAMQQGQKIHITEYNPDGGALTCVDPFCNAELYYTPKTTDQNGHTVPANFPSKSRTDHRDNCSQLSAENNFWEQSLPLKQAVLAGHVIILSLNDHFGLPPQLWRDFGSAAHARHLDTPLNQLKNDARYPDGRKGHRSESIKSVSDLIRVVWLIHKHGGDGAAAKTFVTWQHQVKSFHDFYLKTKEQQKQLFKEIYLAAKHQNTTLARYHNDEKEAHDMPYLLPFYPSKALSEDANARLHSRAIELDKRNQSRLIMQHRIVLPNCHDPNIRKSFTRGSFILASSRVVSSREQKIMEDYTNGQPKNGSCVYMLWNTDGEKQYTPSTGVRLPHVKRSRLLI